MEKFSKIRVLAFDADDTLWDCQSHFEQVEEHLYSLIAPFCDDPKRELFLTETANMADLGYGCKAFTISILETALRVAGNDLSATTLAGLLAHSKQLLHLPATPLPGVAETLELLSRRLGTPQCPPSRMVLFTKGELQDQENKLRRSGLDRFFCHVEITSDKTEREFRQLCSHVGVMPSELMMVGNSFKSDIAPAVAIGCQAVHVPFHVTWQLEEQEEFDHPAITRIHTFADLPGVLEEE